MRTPTLGLVTYVWTCARCGATHELRYEFSRGDKIPMAYPLPDGWQEIGWNRYCGEHKVVTFIDDKLLGSEGRQ